MTNVIEEAPKKNHGIPLDHLDFKYVEQCGDVKELEKIYRVLESGVEGKYMELENFVFDKIKRLAPNSRILRKDLPITSKDGMAKEERVQIDNEIEDFFKNISDIEKKLVLEPAKTSVKEDGLPPVRTKSHVVLNGEKTTAPSQPAPTKAQPAKPKSAKPRDYREWEKIEKVLEKEAEQDVPEEKPKSQPPKNKDDSIMNDLSAKSKALLKNIQKEIIPDDLPENVRVIKADQEKCKGNEAFNAGNFEEALIYYTRSIKYLPNAACYNNRALAYLKLEKWDRTIDDCNSVLEYETENVKALLRRATAYLKKKKYQEATNDIEKCIRLEPSNKKAQELKTEIEKTHAKENVEKEKIQSKGGNRIQIEETDGSDEEEEEEELEVKNSTSANAKVNGHAEKPHESQQKSIPIAEVETDEDDDYEEPTPQIKVEAAKPAAVQKKATTSQVEPVKNSNEKSQEAAEKAKLPEPISKPARQFDLPSKIVELKDKAFKLNTSGQYGDAIDVYSKAIESLKDAISKAKKDDDLVKFYERNLSVLYNNKASCEQSICNYKTCIQDCDLAIDLIGDDVSELRLKLLWKKAQSLEMLEKYDQAFTVFEQIMKLNSNFKNVQQSYNRIKRILSESGQLNKMRKAPTDDKKPANVESSKPKEEKSEPVKVVDTVKQYEELKNKGNDLVKANKFEAACEFYTKCVELDKTNILGYLNRSLCYIKMNKPEQAIQDTTFVLEADKSNVKALFRRATAYRIKESFELAVQDLEKLVAIEANNMIALKELKEIKEIINKSKAEKTSSKQEPVLPAKVLITEEATISSKTTKQETPAPKPSTDKLKVSTTIPTVKIEKKPLDFTKISNAYEFLQAWNSISPKDINSYAQLVANVEPVSLPKFIGSKLDDEMLSKLVKSFHLLALDADCSKHLKERTIVDYLKHLTLTQRFNVAKLFMNQELKGLLKNIFDSKELVGHKDLTSLIKSYDL